MPDPVALFVVATSLFAVGAGVKAVWHNIRLRQGGERPLGMLSGIAHPRSTGEK